MAARIVFFLCSLCLCLSLSCRSNSHELTTRRFVHFYADVVIAQESALDSATAIDSAFAIAERHGISPEHMERFRDRMHDDPAEWIEIWEAVMEEVQSRQGDSE